MNAADFAKYMRDPASMGPEAVQQLTAVVEKFPYFQQAHLLLTLAAKKWDAAIYQNTLKRTAIVANSRARLFELLQQHDPPKAMQIVAKTEPVVQGDSKENPKAELVPPPPVSASKAEVTETAEQKPSVNESDTSEAEATVPVKAEPVAEIDILKAVENMSEEGAAQTATGDPAQLESEIGREVVRAFVEKEVIGTPELHKPQPKPQEKPASFGDWLSYLKKNNGQPYHEIEREVRKSRKAAELADDAEERRKRNRAIMESIIEKNPGHIRVKEEPKFYSPEVKAKDSLLENEHLVTETLAKIYALQGNTAKAIRAYQILSLKNPRKSAYFATLIQELKNQNKNEEK